MLIPFLHSSIQVHLASDIDKGSCMDLTVSFVKESNILGLEGILEIMKALKEPCDLSLKPGHF